MFSPIDYDGAVLKLGGIVTDVTVLRDYGDRDNPEGGSHRGDSPGDSSGKAGYNEVGADDDITTVFKLTDPKGNYVNIILPGSWEIFDGDYIIVGGTYRKNENELEGRQFEMMVFEGDDREEEIEKRDDW